MRKRLSFRAKVIAKRRADRTRMAEMRIGHAILGCLILGAACLLATGVYRRYHPSPPLANARAYSGTLLDGVNADGVPNQVMVEGETWTLVLVDKKVLQRGSIAETDCSQNAIFYAQDQNRTALRQTIAHELFHAGSCMRGGATWWNSKDDSDFNHNGIVHLADFLSGMALANPQFMRWLSGYQ